MACSSGICYQSATDTVGKCVDKLAVAKDSSCTMNSECITNTGSTGNAMYTTCGCAYNEDGDAYCMRAPGNNESDDYWKFVSDWLSSTNSPVNKCNVTDRFSENCMKAQLDSDTYTDYTYALFKASHW